MQSLQGLTEVPHLIRQGSAVARSASYLGVLVCGIGQQPLQQPRRVHVVGHRLQRSRHLFDDKAFVIGARLFRRSICPQPCVPSVTQNSSCMQEAQSMLEDKPPLLTQQAPEE